MSSTRIEELKRSRQRNIRKKKSQIPAAIAFIVFVLFIYIIFLITDLRSSVFWIVGLLIGLVLQKSRFCFTSGFRDSILVGNTSILKAIIIGLIITTIGFGIIQYISINSSKIIDITKVPGQVAPVGIHTVIGSVIFGIGMVIAGGCVSGTLMRIGEGFALQLVVLIGLIIGSLLGASSYEFWDNNIVSHSQPIYIPKYVGFPIAILGQVVILALIYYFVDLYDKKSNILN